MGTPPKLMEDGSGLVFEYLDEKEAEFLYEVSSARSNSDYHDRSVTSIVGRDPPCSVTPFVHSLAHIHTMPLFDRSHSPTFPSGKHAPSVFHTAFWTGVLIQSMTRNRGLGWLVVPILVTPQRILKRNHAGDD